jgi:hypothetical protein
MEATDAGINGYGELTYQAARNGRTVTLIPYAGEWRNKYRYQRIVKCQCRAGLHATPTTLPFEEAIEDGLTACERMAMYQASVKPVPRKRARRGR